MELDISQTVLSSFKRIYSKASLGVLGAFLGLILLMIAGFMIGGALTSVSSILGGIVVIATFLGYLIGAGIVAVGSLRAFDEETFKPEMFTENVFRPFLRLLGANITIQAFVLAVMYIILYPLLLVGMAGRGSMSLATGTAGLSSMAGLMPLFAVGGLAALLLSLYVTAALIVALPRIAINDSRLFQSLDESVQMTSDNRLRVMVSFIPFILLMALAFGGMFQEGVIGMIIYLLGVLLGSFYTLALMTELNERLE
ncbi:MAG: glycerophosphoryl diester phosphodiesterase membrane domain-containing protein [Candidatus Nanohaloarchaea archaeon]